MNIKIITSVAMASVISLQAFAGIDFTADMTTGSKDKSSTRGFVDGPNAKIEFTQGAGKGMQEGSYMLTHDGGKTIYLVNPDEESYMKINPEQMAASVGQFMNATKGLMNMTFSNPTIEKTVDEKSPSMHGLPTRRIVTKTAYTVETSIFGSKSVSHMAREDEMWVTSKLKETGFNLWLKQRSIKTGNEDIDKLIELENSKVDGFPLKVVSITKTTDAKGRQETATTTYEITSLKQNNIPKSTFEIPATYKNTMVEIGKEIEKAQSGIQNSEETEPETDTAVKGAVNSLIKGLFGGGR